MLRTMAVFLILLMCLQAEAAVVPAGTRLDARLVSPIDTATSASGDVVSATLAKAIRVADKVVVPEGVRLNGRVETIEAATDTSEGRVRLVFREIEFPDGRRVPTWMTNSFSASPPKRTLRYALYTGIGAVAGGLIGGHKARVTGILGGTIVGFVIASNSGDEKLPDLELKTGRVVRLMLGEDLNLD